MTQPIDKRESRIRHMFGEIAPWYDFLNHALSLNVDRYWRWRTTKLVPPGPPTDGPILDLCTGTGDLAFGYHRATRGAAEIVGADFCHEMLVRATRKGGKLVGRPVQFLEADAQHLPFAADQFQLVTVAFGLRNVTDHLRGLAEMVRVTRPGGRVAVLEFSRPRHWLFGRLYRWYFTSVLPRFGQWVSRNNTGAYEYLPASVLAFPDGDDMARLMREAGLGDVKYWPFTLGIATLYVGTKPV